MQKTKTAYFQGYSPESDGHFTNPDGTQMYDGHAYYLLSNGKTYADVWWCQENGYKLSDAPSPKVDAPVVSGGRVGGAE